MFIDFYNLRSDVAHGEGSTRVPQEWRQDVLEFAGNVTRFFWQALCDQEPSCLVSGDDEALAQLFRDLGSEYETSKSRRDRESPLKRIKHWNDRLEAFHV